VVAAARAIIHFNTDTVAFGGALDGELADRAAKAGYAF
jgi:hypothetical protein